MAEQIIVCPNCKKEIPLTEVLSRTIKENARKEFESELQEKEAELAKKRESLEKQEQEMKANIKKEMENIQKQVESQVKQREQEISNKLKDIEEKEKKLSEDKSKIDTEITLKVEKEKNKLEKILRKEAEIKVTVELQDLKNQVKEKGDKLQELQQKELELRKEKRNLEDKQKNIDLEVTRKIDEERKKIEETAVNRINEQHRLKDLEKEQQINNYKRQIEELHRKAEVGSQERQGEALETALEDVLRRKFIFDTIEPVKKGERGADIIQKVCNQSGNHCGTIIWEAKNAKNWNNNWIDKLKKDQREEKAEFAVLLTTAFPEGMKNFGYKNGVWITNYELFEGITLMLRNSIIEIANAKTASVGKTEKIESLYNYLTSTAFRQKVETLVESFMNMRNDLDKEKTALMSHWKKREKELERVLMATTGMYGEMQGIIGTSLPEIKGLRIKALEEGEKNI